MADLELRLLGRLTLLRFGAPQTAVDESGALSSLPDRRRLARAQPGRLDHVLSDAWTGGRAARHDRRVLPAARRAAGPPSLDGRALPPGAAAPAPEHQPPLLPPADRRARLKVVVLGATGTVGQRAPARARARARRRRGLAARPAARTTGVTWARADVTRRRLGGSRARGRRRRLLPRALARLLRLRAARPRRRRDGRAARRRPRASGRSSTSAASATTIARPLATPAQPHRDRRARSPRRPSP